MHFLSKLFLFLTTLSSSRFFILKLNWWKFLSYFFKTLDAKRESFVISLTCRFVGPSFTSTIALGQIEQFQFTVISIKPTEISETESLMMKLGWELGYGNSIIKAVYQLLNLSVCNSAKNDFSCALKCIKKKLFSH